MFLSKLSVSGFKIFKDDFIVDLNKGLNILVGENGSGKSAIVDAIRLILQEDEYGRIGINQSDFHRPHDKSTGQQGPEKIHIKCEFNNLQEQEQIIYLPWLNLNDPSIAYLNLSIENKEDNWGKYKRKIWGNESESGLFEWELLNCISCIYLPPLRDAEEKLRAYRGSRLARLLKNLNKVEKGAAPHPLEKKFTLFNKALIKDESISKVNEAIKKNIIDSIGSVFGQDVLIQFSEINFDRIVERLKLLFYPFIPATGTSNPVENFRELEENSLGYNNILYLATILAELEGLSESTYHKVLLIEEPEAHLHPQLQIRLFKYLQKKSLENKIQIIVTTHSPTIASSVDIDSIKVLTLNESYSPIISSLNKCHIHPDSKDFLTRWLDITKSILLFAKGIILVEGIAESLLIKELAKIYIKELKAQDDYRNLPGDELEDFGISIISLGGIYFEHFLSIFKGYFKDTNDQVNSCDFIPIRCACITDCDPGKEETPTVENACVCTNSQLYLIEELRQNSVNCRMYSNLKTFEYDLAMQGNNLNIMAEVLTSIITTDGPIREHLTELQSKDWSSERNEDEKAKEAYWFLNHIESKKGEFAMHLAKELSDNPQHSFQIPQYIKDAIKWSLGL